MIIVEIIFLCVGAGAIVSEHLFVGFVMNFIVIAIEALKKEIKD